MNNYNFPVELQPIYLADNLLIPKQKAVVRTDTNDTLGIVSDDYGLVKHSTVVDAFREAAAGSAVKEKISLTNNGAYMFYQMFFPKVTIEPRKGDIIQMMIMAKNSYNGWSSLQIILGAMRLVCSNGMIIGQQFMRFNFRHVMSINEQNIVDQYRDATKNYIDLFKEKGEVISAMARKDLIADHSLFAPKVDKPKLPKYLLDEAALSFAEMNDKTVWGFYNALTFAITHKMKKESPDRAILYGREAWRASEALLV